MALSFIKKVLFLAFLISYSSSLSAQSKSHLDSLIWNSYEGYIYRDYDRAEKYARKALEFSEQNQDENQNGILRAQYYLLIAKQVDVDSKNSISKINEFIVLLSAKKLWRDAARAHLHLSKIYNNYGDLEKELAHYLLALELYEKIGDISGMSAIYSNLSLVYYDQHEYDSAFANIRKAIALDADLNDPKIEHRDYNNLAIIFENSGSTDSAIYYHKLALENAKLANDKFSIGLSLSNLGNNYVALGEYKLAEETLLKALKIRESIGGFRGLGYTHNRLANLFVKTGQLKKAEYHAKQSLDYAEKANDLKVKRMAFDRLTEIAKANGKSDLELKYFRIAVELSDSIRNERNTRELTSMLMNYKFERSLYVDSLANHQRQLENKIAFDKQLLIGRNQRNISIITGIFFLLLALGFYGRARYIKRSKEKLQKEKERSDNLLLNILPYEVAEELKESGESKAKDFNEVTVIFTDFKEFTQIAEKLSAIDLVSEINTCFKAFDEIIDKYKIEKIKTIGDAYMAAGGLHHPRTSEPADIINAALEMQSFMLQRLSARKAKNLQAFEMRVGIHTGPVVAGIVGVKKFQYDIWGDTVNVASRMENHCSVGKVNISHATYEMVKNEENFVFEKRKPIQVKGKGDMEMYFVIRSFSEG